MVRFQQELLAALQTWLRHEACNSKAVASALASRESSALSDSFVLPLAWISARSRLCGLRCAAHRGPKVIPQLPTEASQNDGGAYGEKQPSVVVTCRQLSKVSKSATYFSEAVQADSEQILRSIVDRGSAAPEDALMRIKLFRVGWSVVAIPGRN